jgi:AcrR family transcriptional regulator
VSDKALSPKAEARTQAQRERILAAAQTCFVNSGFHAASMATIAETAGMSPGLIYRYFENKNAIILTIIEHQLEVARDRIRQLHASNDLVAGIVEHFDESSAGEVNSMSAALFLEMSAEATRDPQIAAALSRFDATVRSEIGDWLRRGKDDGGHGLPADVAPGRALMLVCLIEGLKVRGAREPELDKRLLELALNEVVAALVAAPA